MPRAPLWLTGLLLCLHGCGAVLIVPAIATTQELMRDRKGQFERENSARVGSYLHVACDFSMSPGRYEACGHLVAVRASDLAYLHVHPMGEASDPATPSGPDIAFHTTFPSKGSYRLFLDFQHGDVVRTAAFTVNIGGQATQATQAPAPAPSGGQTEHHHH